MARELGGGQVYEPIREGTRFAEWFQERIACRHCSRPPQLHGFDLLCLSDSDAEKALRRQTELTR